MKLRAQTLSLLILASVGILLSNCGGGGNETPKEKIELKKLSRTWTLTSAKIDGNEKVNNDAVVDDDEFDGVTLAISGTYSSAADAEYNYAIAGTTPSPSPWPKPGQSANKWSFVAAEDGLVLRDPGTTDELAMVYSIANDQLTITFTLPPGSEGWAGGKTANVAGEWVFIFD